MKVDEKLFWSRARHVWKCLQQGRAQQSETQSSFSECDALLIWTDKNPQDEQVDLEYQKSSMMSLHLLDGFEFPETLICFTQHGLFIAASEKKIKMLEPCKGKDTSGDAKLSLELMVRAKEPSGWSAVFQKCTEWCKKSYSGTKISAFIHKPDQAFGKDLQDALSGNGLHFVMNGLNTMEEAFEVKDEKALTSMKDASKKCCLVSEQFRKHIVPNLDDKPMTHDALRRKIDEMLSDEEKDLESGNITAVQSGTTRGAFNFDDMLNWKSPNPSSTVGLDNITLRIAAACKSYHALVARTILIDPSPFQKEAYQLLLDVRRAVIMMMKPGVKASDIYREAKRVMEAQSAVPHEAFSQDKIGYSIGLNLGETDVLSASNQRALIKGATYAVDLRFQDLKAKPNDDSDQKYFSIHFGDVVVVEQGPEGAHLLTEGAQIEWSKNHFRFEEDNEEEEDEDGKANKKENDHNNRDGALPVPRRTTRGQSKSQDQVQRESENKNTEEAMGRRQWERILRKKEENLSKILRLEGGDADGEEDEGSKKKKLVNAYSTPRDFADEWRRERIHVDTRRDCVILPIGDRLVPFHVSTIKSISKIDESADSSSLRFNFFFPTGGNTKDMNPEMIAAIELFPQLTYIKELSFKCRDVQIVTKLYSSIKDLQKRVRDRHKKESEEKDLVEQAELIILKERPKERPATLNDVSMLPSLNLRGNRCMGRLRAHVNGFRFNAEKLGEVDILYSNVKYFFFQRGEKELKVLIHFYLKNPIMIGRKKTKHVQFFTEVQEGGVDLGGRGGDRFDPDEIEDEDRHRRLVQKLNKIFAQFCKQSLEIAKEHNYTIGEDNEIEISNTDTTRKNGFFGMPAREMVLIQPTEHCLVNLTERDFFVISVDEIEHIHLERVSIGKSKNFDIVFILKSQIAADHSGDNIKVVKIESVPMDSFDKVRKWIDDHDGLTYTCSVTMLNWEEVLKQVRYEIAEGTFWQDTYEEDGETKKKDIGWMFLSPVGMADSDEESDDDEDDSEYESSDSDEEEEEDDDDDEYSEDDSDDSLVDEEEDEDDDYDEDEDEGEDWNELERKAQEEDRRKSKRELEYDDRERKKPKKGK
jgi:nucleosome binding factor SPN SPT16 subunit